MPWQKLYPGIEGTYTYTLVSSDASFAISHDTLVTAESFDYETQNSYSIRVCATDKDGSPFEKQFTISVINVNEPPSGISLTNTEVQENQPAGTVVGSLSVTDPDTGDSHTYQLVPGSGDNSAFTIAGTTLKTAQIFEYDTKNSYSIRVRVTDSEGHSFEKQFAVSVLKGNRPPADITLSSDSVPENRPVGTVVGNLAASDPDSGDTHTYTLVSGSDLFSIFGSTLVTWEVFDYETKSSHSIRVRVADSHGAAFEKQFAVGVVNANDPPTDISLDNDSINENRPVGTEVGTLGTADSDTGDSHIYALATGEGDIDNDFFGIDFSDDGSAILIAMEIFNYEARNTYNIRLRTTDSDGLYFEKQFVILINDVNEAPTEIHLKRFGTGVPENEPPGFVVGALSTDDPDIGDTHTYHRVVHAHGGWVDNDAFSIEGNVLKTTKAFNYENKNEYKYLIKNFLYIFFSVSGGETRLFPLSEKHHSGKKTRVSFPGR
ncbi:cadherin repeat domain-containing protein [Desulfonema magnum]|uniref:Cadherin domain-containing protein n=1 Tax=Desulfonema magnum TaxID=45655 RepID=A0A975BV20_9BACT|nr:cadherin repeat domain-containing protein [Desulfonema magnum]QTA91749.1 Cadherin domain-containing protein [Desulfonema magnum]